MFDPKKPVATRDGRKARILATDLANSNYPIAAVVADEDGEEYVVSYTADGCLYHRGEKSEDDLMNVPEKRTVWLGIYEGDKVMAFKDKYDAEFNNYQRLKLIPVEYEV